MKNIPTNPFNWKKPKSVPGIQEAKKQRTIARREDKGCESYANSLTLVEALLPDDDQQDDNEQQRAVCQNVMWPYNTPDQVDPITEVELQERYKQSKPTSTW